MIVPMLWKRPLCPHKKAKGTRLTPMPCKLQVASLKHKLPRIPIGPRLNALRGSSPRLQAASASLAARGALNQLPKRLKLHHEAQGPETQLVALGSQCMEGCAFEVWRL